MQKLEKANSSTSHTEQTKNFHILVMVRIRPTLRIEIGKEIVAKAENGNAVVITTKTNLIRSTFDSVLDSSSTQASIFGKMHTFIPAVLSGFNCTILAYGQTGSGKTHTIFGSDWETLFGPSKKNLQQSTYITNIETDANFAGLIPRSIYHIFQTVNLQQHQERKFAEYLNINLQIRENKVDGIYVEGLTEFSVNNFEDCMNLMKKGEKNRYVRQTSQNVKSSRSHVIFQMIVESTIADKHGKLQKAKLNLCDLAGSEKLRRDEEIEIAHLTELKNINQSLTTLGKVIHNLSSGNKLPIPYRESKLTRLLQDSIGGNTQTCLLATISPILDCIDETLNTLKFAERANHIITKITPNQISATDDALINKLQSEIKHLKEILNLKRKGLSSVNGIHNKLLILQEENQRLRENTLSVQDVEKLIFENREMKLELQKLKYSANTNENASQPILIDAFNDSYAPSIIKGDLITNTTTKTDATSLMIRRKVFENNNDGDHNLSKNDTNIFSYRNNLTNDLTLQTQELSIKSPSDNNNNNNNNSYAKPINTLDLNFRYRGRPLQIKKQSHEKIDFLTEHNKMEERRREQLRSLERLRILDKTKEERIKSIQPLYKSGTNKNNLSTLTSSIDVPPQYAYNVQKVKKEIEEKYNKKRKNDYYASLIIKKNEDYRTRLKVVEKNILS